VGVRGPGETQLEVDRREINRKIAHLKQELEKVRAHRARHRERRRQSRIPVVAIVGYTNAGKSTLLNRLIAEMAEDAVDHSPIYTADQLFATLDPTTRRITLPGGAEVLFSDTVGFIQKLPTELIAAFRATLEEVVEASLLVHVVDITHPNAAEHAAAVAETLRQLNATDIPMVTVLNKMDAFDGDMDAVRAALSGDTASIPVSARTGLGMAALLARVETMLVSTTVLLTIHLPYSAGDLMSLLHRQATIETETHDETGTLVTVRIPPELLDTFEPYRQ